MSSIINNSESVSVSHSYMYINADSVSDDEVEVEEKEEEIEIKRQEEEEEEEIKRQEEQIIQKRINYENKKKTRKIRKDLILKEEKKINLKIKELNHQIEYLKQSLKSKIYNITIKTDEEILQISQPLPIIEPLPPPIEQPIISSLEKPIISLEQLIISQLDQSSIILSQPIEKYKSAKTMDYQIGDKFIIGHIGNKKWTIQFDGNKYVVIDTQDDNIIIGNSNKSIIQKQYVSLKAIYTKYSKHYKNDVIPNNTICKKTLWIQERTNLQEEICI